MAWLPTPTGRTAAEYPLDIHGGNNISSYLLNRPNPYAEAIKQIAPALKEYLAQKRADEIANQYLNMEQPPRAAAIDPSAYDPQLALRQGLNSQTAPQATAPNTGGERAYKADVLYRSLLNEQQDRAQKTASAHWQDVYHQAQANKLNADAAAPDDRIEITLPDGRIAKVTPNEAAQYLKPGHSAAQHDPWENAMAVGRGEMDGDKFVGKNDGKMVKLVTPNGYSMVVPWESYQSRQPKGNAGAELYRSKVQGQQPPLQEPDLPQDTSGQNEAFARAREAIAKGANPAAVKKRLEDAGYDSTGL